MQAGVRRRVQDNPAILKRILDTWCLASGAKFNIAKTEIVPIGSDEYRNRLVTTRKLNEAAAPFEGGVKIAAQGEMTRLLGSFIGNGIDQQAPWQPTVDSLCSILHLWNTRTLSLTGKAIVVRSIVAGKMQYLGTVQGVPEGIRKQITDMVQDFIW
ncbi:hypothetical protein AURDEDRAFT_64361, partial [Auricularia subglabra TFB-10046 SS5]